MSTQNKRVITKYRHYRRIHAAGGLSMIVTKLGFPPEVYEATYLKSMDGVESLHHLVFWFMLFFSQEISRQGPFLNQVGRRPLWSKQGYLSKASKPRAYEYLCPRGTLLHDGQIRDMWNRAWSTSLQWCAKDHCSNCNAPTTLSHTFQNTVVVPLTRSTFSPTNGMGDFTPNLPVIILQPRNPKTEKNSSVTIFQ